MKPILKAFCIALLFMSYSTFGQTEKSSREYSVFILNGISNHLFSDDFEQDYNSAYVNAFRFQVAFGDSVGHHAVLGIQYGKYGRTNNWVCDSGFCNEYGALPIEVKSMERLHNASLIYNSRYLFPKKYYIQGGLSLDIPFGEGNNSTYESSDGRITKNTDFGFKGNRTLFNTTFGVNLILGKQFMINEKWNWVVEIEGKMYNFIAIRFEDFEDYFLEKKEKPWVIGINLGVSLN